MQIFDTYDDDAELVLYKGMVQDFLQTLPASSIDLVVTSPPYNMGKEYEDRRTIEEYISDQKEIISQLSTVISEDGSICWQVGNYVKDKRVIPLDVLYYRIFDDLGFVLRNRIVWHYGHGHHAKRRFSGRYEMILWFTKSDNYTFNLDPVRIPSKYPGKRYHSGPNKGKPSGNPLGKNPSDVWERICEDWEAGYFEIPNVKANHKEKTEHPCQFPIALVERCVLALTNEGDRVFDPFAGVGSTLIAALRHNRRAIGCEKEERYIQIAQERLQQHFNGTLKVRELGENIHMPNPNQKVAKVPEEWEGLENTAYD